MRTVLLSGLLALVVLAPAAAAAETEEIVEIDGPVTYELVDQANPRVNGDSYSVRVDVRYENVVGPAYVEMWSYFADGGAYFSRTLAESGSQGAMSGDSPGRTLEAPFFLNGAAPPARIVVNVVLPGTGRVWVDGFELEGIGGPAPWFTQQQAGWFGAIGGSLAGLVGGLIGWLSRKGQNQRIVEKLLIAGVAVGVVGLVAGGAAWLTDQPRYVSYPLLLLGAVLTVVDGGMLPLLKRSQAAAELQRIRAMDTAQ